MEHLALEIFDLDGGTGSQYAWLPEDASITIIDTSEIFASGDVWSYSFKLNILANAHIFGTAGEIHGSRLHEQINRRRARLWVVGLPLFLGYLKLDDEVNVDENGDVDVTFESGQKTFEDMIEGTSARNVSVGDVVIGVALNRKRLLKITHIEGTFKPKIYHEGTFGTGSNAHVVDRNPILEFKGSMSDFSPYTHRWPKLVLSKGILDNLATGETGEQIDYTNVQESYSDKNPFCNVNVSYQKKHKNNPRDPNSEDVTDRGYIVRLANGSNTTTGGDNETRFNNAPNFYLLHWLKRLFMDLGIHIEENQMLDVEDLKRVFLANLGCFYKEMDLNNDTLENYAVGSQEWERYGKYSFPENFISENHTFFKGDEDQHKVLIHRIESERFGRHNSLTGEIVSIDYDKLTVEETGINGYLAYATGDNYPNVDISEIIKATESAFGVRFLFSNDFKRVRIVLLRNIFKDNNIQKLNCDIIDDSKRENSIRGFKMTYGGDKDDTTFFYKGFDDMLPKKKEIWRDNSDTHDYSQWKLNAEYADILTRVTSFNKTCYVTPVNGNAYGVKIDEEEEIFYPSLFEYAGYMDAEDGDCTGEEETIKTVAINAKPLIMNNSDGAYSVFHNGDMKAPGLTQVAALIPVLENYPFEPKIEWDTMPAHGSGGGGSTHHEEIAKVWADIFIKEGYIANLQDNYSFTGNDGTSFDKADIGLCFGIMRGSGDDAFIKYEDDETEEENPINQCWEVVPGSGAVCHPDTCDEYGEEWDYDGSQTITPSDAPAKLAELFPNSDAPFNDGTLGYITNTTCMYSNDRNGKTHVVLLASEYSVAGETVTYSGDIRYFVNLTLEELQEVSRTSRHVIVEVDSSNERGSTLVQLCKLAYGGGTDPMVIDNGVGSRYGRFSLKLRAEKLNPYFNPKQVEGSDNRRYLPITNMNLRRRGLSDQFYKGFSYFIRNARVAIRQVRMELAQLRAIDKTVRVTVGDVTGFVLKMQYTISNKTGLGMVTMEIMYI